MNEPPVIDHDENEPPRDRTGNGIYWASAFMLMVLWIGYFWIGDYDWPSVALGTSTGLFIAIWGIAVTGNKTPKWMR